MRTMLFHPSIFFAGARTDLTRRRWNIRCLGITQTITIQKGSSTHNGERHLQARMEKNTEWKQTRSHREQSNMFQHSIKMGSSEKEKNKQDGRQIVLVSGGIESSTLLRQVFAKYGDATLPIFFDYGQRAVRQERSASRQQWQTIGLHDVLELDLGELGQSLRMRQKERRHVPLYHRNAILLAVAASVAAQEGASAVWIAVCKDDLSWYPSASKSFLNATRSLYHTLETDLELCTPLTELTKSEVLHLGLQIGVHFGTTWSCMLDRENHCGRCTQCRARKAAFAECDVEDDTVYER